MQQEKRIYGKDGGGDDDVRKETMLVFAAVCVTGGMQIFFGRLSSH